MINSSRRAFTLIELLAVIFILAILVAVLLPTLSSAKRRAMVASMDQRESWSAPHEQTLMAPGPHNDVPLSRSLARITAFSAQIELTPRLSVGTAEAESIYEAKFTGHVKANATSDASAESQILFPLPPQIISLSDLTFKINGEPSDAVSMDSGRLVWHGKLPAQPTPVELTYTAVGKGVYSLDIPPGGILETFSIDLASVGSDVRMLETSLQPAPPKRVGGKTLYKWDYKNLVFGRPIALDVLGIAPIDRLGELTWLGPLSVVLFGLLVGLYASAYNIQKIDRWMLLLIIGTFTGAYPLMYFAQEFTHPTVAILLSAAIVILIIAVRAVTIMGLLRAFLGIILPAAAVMTLTLFAALNVQLQGILLTVGTLAFFIVAMSLAPRLKSLAAALKTSKLPPHPPA